MAAANKSTGLQVALVFAVMSMIIAFVVAFLQYRDAGDRQALLDTANKKISEKDSQLQTATTNLAALQAFVGFPASSEVGKPEAEGDSSVIGQTRALITKWAPGDLARPTVDKTIERLGQEVDTLQKTRADLTAESLRLKEQITGLQNVYQKSVDSHEAASKKAEKDRDEAQHTKEHEVVAKEKESEERQAKIQELQASLQAADAKLNSTSEDKNKQIANLETINSGLRREKAALENPSFFDVPSGQIEYVDRETNLVWINRGEADTLRKGTTFSVWKQINKGVARGSQDIKGSIEVTRIVGPHQAEARITKSVISEPMIAGDPIYTPLWNPGRKETFAFVGLIDLDGDTIGDREMLHDLVAASNGVIVDEVDDKGIRHPPGGKISVGTKFLVVGKIPDYTESKPEDRDGHKLIGELHTKMTREAEAHGVRIVSLETFLDYIGYQASRRIWRNGVTPGWNLHQGAEGMKQRPDRASRHESPGITNKPADK